MPASRRCRQGLASPSVACASAASKAICRATWLWEASPAPRSEAPWSRNASISTPSSRPRRHRPIHHQPTGISARRPPEHALDRPLPFAALRRADADLRFTGAEVRLKSAEYRAIEAHLVLQDGKLRLDPANLTAPSGAIQARLGADAAATPPTAALALQAPKLNAAPIAAAAGASDLLTGALDLNLDLQAAGNTLRAMIPTLNGHAGIALTDGQIGNKALVGLFGALLRAANLPIDARGESQVRCLAGGADVTGGQAEIRAFALDTSRIQLQAEGSVNLVNDTLNLRVRPTISIGGVNVGGPVRLTGLIASPTPALERGGIAPGRFGFSLGVPFTDVCGPALAAARAPARTTP